MNEYSMIITTFPNKESAKKLAHLLVVKRIAACVQLFPIESVYIWKDEVCDENEIILCIKSRTELFTQIAETIKQNHTYEVPEIVQIPIMNGLPEYLKWIGNNTK